MNNISILLCSVLSFFLAYKILTTFIGISLLFQKTWLNMTIVSIKRGVYNYTKVWLFILHKWNG